MMFYPVESGKRNVRGRCAEGAAIEDLLGLVHLPWLQ